MNDHVAGVIWLSLGVVLLAFAALFITEGILYELGQPKITTYIRDWTLGHYFVMIFVGIALVVGVSMAITHFILDAGNG